MCRIRFSQSRTIVGIKAGLMAYQWFRLLNHWFERCWQATVAILRLPLASTNLVMPKQLWKNSRLMPRWLVVGLNICQPEYFPVVVAAVKAALDTEFNLGGNAATTGGAAQVLIVNGPIADELGINGDAACFGPGFRANAVIGRAVRLVIRNVGGLIPGEMDKATLATPGRYSFCFSENESRSPWEPRNISLGYPEGSNTVTVFAVRGVYTIMETTVATGLEVLQTIVGNMKAVGISNYYQIGTGAQIVVVICPEHADEIASSGLTKSDVQEFIYQNARMPLSSLVGRAHYGNRNWPSWVDETNLDTLVPIVRGSGDIVPIVAGGDGRHSAWLAGWGVTRMSTEEIIKNP